MLFSAWLVVAFTFERLIVVRYPLKRWKICTVRRAKSIIAYLTLTVIVIQIIALFTTGEIHATSPKTVNSSNSTIAADDDENSQLFYYYLDKAMHLFNVLEAFFTLVVPPVSIVVMNTLIVHGLAQYNRTFTPGNNRPRPSSITTNATQQREENIEVLFCA